MTNEEILESNKLIAEFVGWKQSDGQDGIYHKDQWYSDKYDFLPPEQVFKFHSSLDWLMPVVEKIESLGSNIIMGRTLYSRFEITHNHIKLNWSKGNSYQLYLEVIPYWMDGRRNTIGVNKEYLRVEIQQETTKIESLYIAVVEFIKWYNKQIE